MFPQLKRKKQACESIEMDIKNCEMSLKAADEIISDANNSLQKALAGKKLDRNLVQQAQSKIEIGIDRKRKLEETLASLKKKKCDLC